MGAVEKQRTVKKESDSCFGNEPNHVKDKNWCEEAQLRAAKASGKGESKATKQQSELVDMFVDLRIVSMLRLLHFSILIRLLPTKKVMVEWSETEATRAFKANLFDRSIDQVKGKLDDEQLLAA